jgi:hypothetical protein
VIELLESVGEQDLFVVELSKGGVQAGYLWTGNSVM